MVFSLTITATNQTIAIDDSNIIYVEASDSGSKLTYYNFGNVLKQVIVTDSPSTIATASGAIFSVTAYDIGSSGSTSTRYINALRVSPLIIDNTSYRTITYNEQGAIFQPINVTDSVNTLLTAINVSSSDYVTIAGTQTISGTKTFSAVTAFSNTTDSTSGSTGSINTAGGIGASKAIFGATSLTYGTLLTEGLTTGITAFAGGGQASATALTTSVNNVTVCATNLDSVKLPAAATGLTVTVKNSGAAVLAVFPAASDSIDALAINLAVRIYPGSVVTFRAISAVVWESDTDAALTLNSPTTNTGQLVILAADNAGNTTTTVTNASQAASRLYTIPDAGANAEFVMGAGAQSIAGAKTFTTAPIFQNRVVNQSADGAITPSAANITYYVTKAGVCAMTIANPTATTHDGARLTFISTTAQAHTLSNAAGAGFNAGGAGGDVGTFGGAIGDNIVIEAYQGVWYVVSKVNVTLG